MQRLVLKVTDRLHERFADTHRFQVRGNGILFEILVHNSELNEQKINEVNAHFANSLRVVKHTGGYFDETVSEKDAKGILEKLTSTDTGIGIKVKDDSLKEFIRFSL